MLIKYWCGHFISIKCVIKYLRLSIQKCFCLLELCNLVAASRTACVALLRVGMLQIAATKSTTKPGLEFSVRLRSRSSAAGLQHVVSYGKTCSHAAHRLQNLCLIYREYLKIKNINNEVCIILESLLEN